MNECILKNDSNINYTSSDWQKFNIKSSIDSTNAGFSLKYFGTAKGVSVYTFLDESHKLFYSKHHKLYTAIKEFGKIIKTDFLLTYIDDVGLRQRIEKQLNKIESANRFSKAVFFGNNAEFIFATQEEQNIANNCKRLIQNAVILWNYQKTSRSKITITKRWNNRSYKK